MKVKIGNKIYDADKEPIMIIFGSEEEKSLLASNISNMASDTRKYCEFPNGFSEDAILVFMGEWDDD